MDQIGKIKNLTPEEREERCKLKKEFETSLKDEEISWRQKSDSNGLKNWMGIPTFSISWPTLEEARIK